MIAETAQAASETSASLSIVVDEVSPGIFSFSADGKGAGAITHAAGTR